MPEPPSTQIYIFPYVIVKWSLIQIRYIELLYHRRQTESKWKKKLPAISVNSFVQKKGSEKDWPLVGMLLVCVSRIEDVLNQIVKIWDGHLVRIFWPIFKLSAFCKSLWM